MYIVKKIFSELGWIAFVVGRRIKSRALFLKRRFVVPRLPQNPDGSVLIHLGCGDIASPEFVNVDVRPAPHIHYVCNVTDLSVFPEDYADLIYACHVLEHIRHPALRQTLWEWRRVLKPGGVLRLSVPDFDKIVHIYELYSRDVACIIDPLLGSQNYEYDAHYSTFNHAYLCAKLAEVGFGRIQSWDPACVEHHDFEDWASLQLQRAGREYQISLNIEAVK